MTTTPNHQTVPADEWDLDHLDNALNCFDGVAVEGGTDAAEEDGNCAGGACKI
ncbi:hypothetical protein V6667_02140 [Neisseria leonii]|uniref:Uncharacterized protein n=1 Tax=Neisseria leonii TaxID=2995413 RepID=A0A9X4IDL7_9NEIS|nr:hypothetical protein [Neisseria sp. 51.81]MDD9327342.1 hypothetical protein [Neisseria sp. 51.81]